MCVFFCCHCYCCSWLHVCVLRFVEVARIGLPPAIYLGPPSPAFPSLPLSVYLPLSIFLGFFNFVALFLYTRLQFSCFFSFVYPSLSWLDLYYVYYIFPYEIHSLPLNTVCCFCCPPCFWHCDWTLTGYSLDKHLVCPFCRRKLIYCALNVPGRQVQVKSD